jgi:membrane protein
MGRAVAEFFDDRCQVIAAAIAYYALFSLFPLAILVVGGFGIVVGEAEARGSVIDFLLDNLPLEPGKGRRDLRELLESVAGNAPAFGLIGVAGLIFAASGLMGAVRNGINAAFDAERRRPPLQGKLVDVLLVLGVGLVICLSLGLTVFARVVGPPAGALLGRLIPIALTFGVSLFLYRVLPQTQPRRAMCGRARWWPRLGMS